MTSKPLRRFQSKNVSQIKIINFIDNVLNDRQYAVRWALPWVVLVDPDYSPMSYEQILISSLEYESKAEVIRNLLKCNFLHKS